MRSLAIVLLLLAALLAPTTALAAGSSTAPPSRFFTITGLVFGDQRLEVSGKLSIEDGHVMASVGCNAIGGEATLSGDTVTIPGPLVTTLMGCPSVSGNAEAMLIKILQGAGPFTIADGAWRGTDAAILVQELPAGPGPGASLTPPDDGVVSSSPQPAPPGPSSSCLPIPGQTNGTTQVGGGPGSVSGSGAAGTAGGSGTGVGTGSTSGSAGASGSETGPAETAQDIAAGTPGVEPPGPPSIQPGSSVAEPPPPIGTEPGVGKPADAGPCADRSAAYDQATGGGGVEPPTGAEAASAHATDLSTAGLVIPAGIGLGIVMVIALLALRHLRSAGRPARADGDGLPHR